MATESSSVRKIRRARCMWASCQDGSALQRIAAVVYHRHMTMNGRALVYHALSEPTRLALLEHLRSGEHRVRDLVDHMGLAQSTVSVHLACLRDAGLVTVRAEGRASWFSLRRPDRLDALLRSADDLVAEPA